jgi:hypothetical protein
MNTDKIKNVLEIINKQKELIDSEQKTISDAKNIFNVLSIEEKAAYLFDFLIDKISKFENQSQRELLDVYIKDNYNPSNLRYDINTTLINLLIIKRMIEFEIMDFYFDERENLLNVQDIDLNNEWWDTIINTNKSNDEKHIEVSDKVLKLKLYSSIVNSMSTDADRISYNDSKLKYTKILSLINKTDEKLDENQHLLEYILKKAPVGSSILMTEKISKLIHLDDIEPSVSEEEMKKNQVTYLGTWEGRQVFDMNLNEIYGNKKYSDVSVVGCITSGNEHRNKFIINPTKPIVYFHTVDTPYYERPHILVFSNYKFKFFKSASLIIDIETLQD